MSPENRMILRKSMTVGEAVGLYAQIAQDPAHGPRLSKPEWIALGEDGQKDLQKVMEEWEVQITNEWTTNNQAEVKMALSLQKGKDAFFMIQAGVFLFFLIGGYLFGNALGAMIGTVVGVTALMYLHMSRAVFR